MWAVMLWFRRGANLVALPAMAVAAGIALFSRGLPSTAPWVGEAAWSVDWALGATTLVGPFAGAVAALDMLKLRHASMLHIVESCPKAGKGYRNVIVASTVCGTTTVVLAATLALGITIGAHGSAVPDVRWAQLFFCVPVLLLYVCLGAFVARLFNSAAAVPVVGIGLFLLALVTANGVLPRVLRIGGVTGSLAGVSVDFMVLAYQAAAALGLSGLLWIGIIGISRLNAWGRPAAAALVGLLAATTVVGISGLALHGDDPYVVDAGARSDECETVSNGALTVCVNGDNIRALPAFAAKMSKYRDVLVAETGARVPSRYDQELPGYRPPADRGVFAVSMTDVNASGVSNDDAAYAIVRPRACAAWYEEAAPATALDASRVMVTWLLVRAGDLSTAGMSAPAVRWFTGSESDAWVRSTFADFRTCELSAVVIPAGVKG